VVVKTIKLVTNSWTVVKDQRYESIYLKTFKEKNAQVLTDIIFNDYTLIGF